MTSETEAIANLLVVGLLYQLLGVVQLSDQGVLRTDGRTDREREKMTTEEGSV